MEENNAGCLIVGEGVKISGSITLPERVDVDGQIDGEIIAKEIHVGQSGKLTGKISAGVIDVRGED